MVGHSSVLNCELSQNLRLFGYMRGRKHADIGTYPQNLFFRNCIAVEGSAIKEDEVSGLRVNLDAILQGLFLFIFLGNQKPILFIILHLLLDEVLTMIKIRTRHTDKASLVFSGVSQRHHSLITPNFVLRGRLINVQKGVYRYGLIVPHTIHEAKPIKRAFQVFCLPELLKYRNGSLPQLPLRLRVTDILYHSTVKDRRVVFAEYLGGRIFSVESAISEYFHDIPKILNILVALFLGQPISNHNKTLFFKMGPPSLLIFEGKSIGLVFLHSQSIQLSLMTL